MWTNIQPIVTSSRTIELTRKWNSFPENILLLFTFALIFFVFTPFEFEQIVSFWKHWAKILGEIILKQKNVMLINNSTVRQALLQIHSYHTPASLYIFSYFLSFTHQRKLTLHTWG